MSNCFGFYTGDWVCREGGCKMVVQCKALVNSDCLDVVGDCLDELEDRMEEGQYQDTDSYRAMLAQVLKGPIQVVKANPSKAGPKIPNVLEPDDDVEQHVLNALGLT